MLRRFLLADAVSSLGDWVTYVGISVLAIGQGHDGLALVVVLIAHTLPRVLCASFAGALADHVDRRTMLVVASAARGVAAAAMVLAALEGSLWLVHGLHLVRMALGAFTDAAARAALPRLVGASRLPRANALLGASWSATFVLGVAIGGEITASWGVAAAFAIDAATFFIAAGLFAGLPRIAVDRAPITIVSSPLSSELRRIALAKVPLSIATGALWILINLAAGQSAGPGDVALAIGAVHVARAAGNGIATVIWPRSWRASMFGIHVSIAIGFIGIAGFSGSGMLVWAAVWGFGFGANWMTTTTVLQTLAPDRVVGRAAAIDVAAQALAQCAGGVLALAIVTVGGTSLLVGLVGIAAGTIAWAAIAGLGAARGTR